MTETLVANCEAGFIDQESEGKIEKTLCLTYSQNKDIRIGQKHSEGSEAIAQIIKWIGPDGWNLLKKIWAKFPDAVIEFTAHNTRLGPKNMFVVIWEVRDY